MEEKGSSKGDTCCALFFSLVLLRCSHYQILQQLAIKMLLCHLGKQQFPCKCVLLVFVFCSDVWVRTTVDMLCFRESIYMEKKAFQLMLQYLAGIILRKVKRVWKEINLNLLILHRYSKMAWTDLSVLLEKMIYNWIIAIFEIKWVL